MAATSSTPRRRTPAKKTAAAVKTMPVRKAGPGVVLDLDTLTKRQAFPDLKMPARPFTFLLNAVQYELKDPRDTDWKLALELSANPFLLMRTCLEHADEPVDDPSDYEMQLCRERLGLVPDPLPDSEAAKEEAELYPDGIRPSLIDRWTAVDLPGWKLNALFARWHEHYRIDLSDGKGVLAALLGKDT